MRFVAHDDVLLMLNMGAQYCVIASEAKQSNGMESFMILGFLARWLPRSHVVLARNDR